MSENNDYLKAQRVAAQMKSYIGAAVLVFFLYLLFFFPGFITNIIYLNEAKRMQRVAGQKLPGVGCLSWMLWLNIAFIVLAIIGLCVFAALTLVSGISQQ